MHPLYFQPLTCIYRHLHLFFKHSKIGHLGKKIIDRTPTLDFPSKVPPCANYGIIHIRLILNAVTQKFSISKRFQYIFIIKECLILVKLKYLLQLAY